MSTDGAATPERAKSVFISYARVDRPRVTVIAAALSSAGYEVWWDAMIDGGTEFARMIEAKLAAADAAIVIWSKSSVGSDWVRDEAAYARDRKRLVPVSLDGTEPPLGFRQYHAIDLSGWKGSAEGPEIASLLRGVAAVGSGGAAVRATDLPPPPRAVASRRAVLIGGGGVAAVAVTGGLIAFKPWQSAAQSSVAVLPFANLSGDPTQAYFSDGLSEEVRAALSRIAELKVAAPTSSSLFRDAQNDAKAIGAKLGVGYLLEGSVRKSGDILRIAANLVDAVSGFSNWSQTFDRKMTDVFALQSEIAQAVAEALTVQVAAANGIPGGTNNVAAYDAFLKGRDLSNADAGEASDRAALAQFDAALTLDPGYAAAHAARSRSVADIASSYGQPGELRAMYDDAIAAAQKAVALAPVLAAGHWALGHALFYGRLDPKSGKKPFDRAYALAPGDADVANAFGIFALRTGRTAEAEGAIGHAATLDSLNARVFRASGLIAQTKGDPQAALRLYDRALALSPKLAFVRAQQGAALLKLGQLPAARAAYAAEPVETFRLAGLAVVDWKRGEKDAARAHFARMVGTYGDNSLYQQGEIFAQWGDTAQALRALSRAIEVNDSGLTTILIDPLLDPLRSAPEFSGLLKRLGFA